MFTVVGLPRSVQLTLKALSNVTSIDVVRAIDYAMSAERQLWRVLSNLTFEDLKVYELALMVAAGNIDDSIKNLRSVRQQIDTVLAQLKS